MTEPGRHDDGADPSTRAARSLRGRDAAARAGRELAAESGASESSDARPSSERLPERPSSERRPERSSSERSESRSADPDESELTPTLEPTGEDEAPHDSTGLGLAAMIAHSARGAQLPPARRGRQQRRPPQAAQFSGARSDARDPQPLGAAFERLTEQRGWNTELSVRSLFARWPQLVGDSTAQHSSPESYEDGVVVVRCDSTAWATQLRLLAPQLVASLNADLGDGTVTRLVIKGPDAPSWKHGRRSVSDGRGPRDTYG